MSGHMDTVIKVQVPRSGEFSHQFMSGNAASRYEDGTGVLQVRASRDPLGCSAVAVQRAIDGIRSDENVPRLQAMAAGRIVLSSSLYIDLGIFFSSVRWWKRTRSGAHLVARDQRTAVPSRSVRSMAVVIAETGCLGMFRRTGS